MIDQDHIFIYVIIGLMFLALFAYVFMLLWDMNNNVSLLSRNLNDVTELVTMNIGSNEEIQKNLIELKILNGEMNNRMLLNTQQVLEEKNVDVDDLNIVIDKTDETMNNGKITYLDLSPSESKKSNINNID